MEPLGARPIALVLPGGAAFGSWQAGCVYALAQKGLPFHSVFGTSVGALTGCAYFQDTMELSWKIWRSVNVSSFFKVRPRLNPPSVFSHEHLRAYLSDYIDEPRARALKRCWFYVVSTDIASGRTHQACYSPEPDGEWDGPLLDHVLGSISIPFMMPPVRVEAPGGRRLLLLDGNAKSYVNLRPAVERGALDILYLSVLDPQTIATPKFNLKGYIATLLNQLLQGQVEHSLDSLRDLASAERKLRAYVFYPSRPLTMGGLSFDEAACRAAFDLGLEDAGRLIEDPESYRRL